MDKFPYKIAISLEVLGLLSGFFDKSYALGYTLGAVLSYLIYKGNVRYWNSVLDFGRVGKTTGMGHSFLNYGIMAAAMIFCVKVPSWFNIFALTLGLFNVKVSILLHTYQSRKEECG